MVFWCRRRRGSQAPSSKAFTTCARSPTATRCAAACGAAAAWSSWEPAGSAASSLRRLARAASRVTVIDPLALPNERIFGPEIGAFYRDVHRDQGVELLLGANHGWAGAELVRTMAASLAFWVRNR